jgi:hypothetical protein
MPSFARAESRARASSLRRVAASRRRAAISRRCSSRQRRTAAAWQGGQCRPPGRARRRAARGNAEADERQRRRQGGTSSNSSRGAIFRTKEREGRSYPLRTVFAYVGFPVHGKLASHKELRRFVLHVVKEALRLYGNPAQAKSRFSYRDTRDRGHYSHSTVAGGFEVISYATRFTPGTSLTIRVLMRSSNSCGSRAQSAVMPSSLVIARTATRFA